MYIYLIISCWVCCSDVGLGGLAGGGSLGLMFDPSVVEFFVEGFLDVIGIEVSDSFHGFVSVHVGDIVNYLFDVLGGLVGNSLG